MEKWDWTGDGAEGVPSREQQRAAMAAGRGSVKRWAHQGLLDPDVLLEGCLNDLRFDKQCNFWEEGWHWELMQVAGVVERFREPILKDALSANKWGDLKHRLSLVWRYAQSGDAEAAEILRQAVHIPVDPEISFPGQRELLQLDGEQGLLRLARIRGEQLLQRETVWHDASLVESSIGTWGESRVYELLSGDPTGHGLRLWNAVQEWFRREEDERQTHSESPSCSPYQDITLELAMDILRNDPQMAFRLRKWGMKAPRQELEAVHDLLSQTDDPEIMRACLRVFEGREETTLDERFLPWLDHPVERVHLPAYNVLSKQRSPRLWAEGRRRIELGIHESLPFRLLQNSYQAGEEDWALETALRMEDSDHRHWALSSIIDMLENFPEAAVDDPGLRIYDQTPCSNCRSRVVRLLVARGNPPEWLLQDCLNDADGEIRDAVTRDSTSDEN